MGWDRGIESACVSDTSRIGLVVVSDHLIIEAPRRMILSVTETQSLVTLSSLLVFLGTTTTTTTVRLFSDRWGNMWLTLLQQRRTAVELN